ncbi:DUF6198 family protein [Desulfovibrio sp. OttesenSCG-928-O18]|nr:DUF6198 family protein [Desulfovibrio sp. OttesenSCG-928-O18]
MTIAQRKYAFRYFLFFIGLSLMALGIALTTLANLGTTPISALPFVASLGLPPSMGFFTASLNMLLIALQIAILRGKFPKEQYLQIPASIIFGSFIDFWMHVVPLPDTMTYSWSLVFLALGTLVLAFGIFVEVSADVVVMAGEGAVLVLAMLFRREFGLVKTVFDTSLVLLAVLLSLLLFGKLQGVREGTLVSALCVGFIVKFFFSLKGPKDKENAAG